MAKFDHWSSPIGELEKELPRFIERHPVCEQWNVRCDPDDPEFRNFSAALIGEALPLQSNRTITGKNGVKALWLAPDEWLVISNSSLDENIEAVQKVKAHTAVTDLSANRLIFSIKGADARVILAKCCDFDFHPSVFAIGNCAQTLFAKSQALIECIAEDEFHIYVRNSFSRYVAELLIDASKEFS